VVLVVSRELDSEVVEMTNELVMDTNRLELELLRRLKDVELTDVLDMGYKVLLELNALLGLEMRLMLVLSAVAELLAVMLSLRLVESPDLDVAAVAPPLELLPPRLEGMFALEGNPRLVEDPEPDGAAVFVEDAEFEGVDGRKMTVAKISPGEILRLCALNRVKGVHDERLSTKEAARQLACSAHSARHAVKTGGIKGRSMA